MPRSTGILCGPAQLISQAESNIYSMSNAPQFAQTGKASPSCSILPESMQRIAAGWKNTFLMPPMSVNGSGNSYQLRYSSTAFRSATKKSPSDSGSRMKNCKPTSSQMPRHSSSCTPISNLLAAETVAHRLESCLAPRTSRNSYNFLIAPSINGTGGLDKSTPRGARTSRRATARLQSRNSASNGRRFRCRSRRLFRLPI